MANSPDSSVNPSVNPNDPLPPPELNPLLNPVLERNLGRWAQVYFTSPPEQRNAAVGALLRELKAETSEPNRQSAAPPQPAETSVEPPPNRNGDREIEWLRSKNLSLAYNEEPSRPRWIIKILGPILALVAFAFLYSQWKPRLTTQQQTVSVAAPMQTATQPATPALQPNDQPSEATASAQGLLTTVAPTAGNLGDGISSPQTREVPGHDELLRAQEYLEGRNGPKDSSAAAEWLWRAVRWQNPAAELLLADLYLRGEGVPRNCEQARLLLVAAAKRGQSEAVSRLQNLESSGCP